VGKSLACNANLLFELINEMGNAINTSANVQVQASTSPPTLNESSSSIDKSYRSVRDVIYYNEVNGEELIVHSNGFSVSQNSQESFTIEPYSKQTIVNAILLVNNTLLTYESDDSLRIYRMVNNSHLF
jgi:hypothetical protein